MMSRQEVGAPAGRVTRARLLRQTSRTLSDPGESYEGPIELNARVWPPREMPGPVGAPPPRPTGAALLGVGRARSSALGPATLLGYVLLSAFIFGRAALGDIEHTVVGFGQRSPFYGRDQSAFVWFLAWGAHAASHLQNPFVTHAVYAPGGYNLAWAASILGPALLLAPLTELWGPITTYDVLAILAPAGAAWGAYLLCRDLTTRRSSAVVGGLLFGFGSYEATQTVNHLNLALVGLLPIAALLTLRRATGRISRRSFLLGAGVVLGAQLWISTEMFASVIIFGAVALAVGCVTRDAGQRRAVQRTAYEAVGVLALAALIGAPYLWYALTVPDPFGGQSGVNAGADLANFLLPTRVTWLHPLTTTLASNLTEQLAYLGPVLLIVLGLFFVEFRGRRLARYLAVFLVAAAVLSLGGVLIVAGQSTGVSMPWSVLGQLPLLSHALPGRFVVYVQLAAALCVALWLDRPTARPGRWLAMALVVASLVPNLDGALWGTRVDQPVLLSSPALARYVPTGATVLALPFGSEGNSMYWQVQAGFAFRLAGGYVSWALPREYQGLTIIRELTGKRPRAGLKQRLCTFIATTHTSIVLLRTGTRGDWRAILRPLRERPVYSGGFAIYRVDESACAARSRPARRGGKQG